MMRPPPFSLPPGPFSSPLIGYRPPPLSPSNDDDSGQNRVDDGWKRSRWAKA